MSIQLKETSSGIHGDDRRYFADGKRISREQFEQIKSSATRLECFQTTQVNGQWHFYCIARS